MVKMNETHVFINEDNHRTLRYVSDPNVNYAEVSSGGEGISTILNIIGGVNSKIEAPFVIFKNCQRKYPIKGVPDDVPGASYRTGPRTWIEATLFNDWLDQKRLSTRIRREPRKWFLWTLFGPAWNIPCCTVSGR